MSQTRQEKFKRSSRTFSHENDPTNKKCKYILFLVESVFVLVPLRLGPSDYEVLNVYMLETDLGPSLAFLTRLLLLPFERQDII